MSFPSKTGGARDRPDPRADALDAAVRLSRIRQQMFARADPARIAQYIVMRRIGGGAMGLVFAARDPSLDRTVAIKVLREPDDGGGKQLRAEAQSLARLGHPNVVTVFEVGEHEGQLYLAMEYVEGQTLREWVAQWRSAATRDWSALRGVFIQAARGLAAAHSAGVVHRDVKPENVMIDRDGRVRVMDFGLAREHATPRAEITGQGRVAHDLRGDLASTHTRVCGTPAYMAPEQFEGRLTGAAADQFALGASLFEAMYGRRLRSDTLAAAATANDPIELPAERGIPRALRATVSRLLAIAPEDRFASMDQVVTELSRQDQRRATRWVAGAVGTVIAATGIAAGFAIGAPEDPRCTGAAEELAGVWDEQTAAEIQRGLEAEGSGLGASTWAWVGPKLDAYSQAWVDEFRETCEATRVRRELSVAEMDRRVACLYDRRRHLGAAVEILRDVRPRTLSRAVAVMGGLPGVDACSDPDYVAGQRFPEADDPAGRERAEAIAIARANFIMSRTPEAHAQVQASLAEARRTEDVVAEALALLLLGRITGSLRRPEEARALLVAAYDAARRHELPVIAADAALTLSKLTTRDLRRVDEGRVWQSLIELEWPATGDVRRTMLRALARSMVERSAGDVDAALEAAEQAQALTPRVARKWPLMAAQVRRALARVYLSSGRLEPGIALAEQSLEELEAVVGEGHPATASGLETLAQARRNQGDMAGALQAARKQLAAIERGLGDDRKPLIPALDAVAIALSRTGAVDEALEALDRADSLVADGGNVLIAAKLYSHRGDVLAERDPAAAAEHFRRAYDLVREEIGEDNRETLSYRFAWAVALRQAGDEVEADAILQGGLKLADQALGQSHSGVAWIRELLGTDAMERGEYEVAVDHFQHALAFWGDEAGSAFPRLPVHVGLCAAQAKAGRPAIGLEHCEKAQAILDRAKGVNDGTQRRLHLAFVDALTGLGETAKADHHRTLAQR